MPKIKLQKRDIDAIKATGERCEYWDKELNGFLLRVGADGSKVFYLVYRNAFNQKRRFKIGEYGPNTPDDARRAALDLLSQIQHGGDPAAEKQNVKQAITFSEFADKYLTDYAEIHKKPRSIKDDRYNLDRFLRPGFGKKPVMAITRAEVTQLHNKLKKTPVPANRCLALLSKMLNLAEAWGVRPDGSNPCHHVQKFKEVKRQRYMDGGELNRLAQAVTALEAKWNEEQPLERDPAKKEKDDRISPAAASAIRLLLLTGCRCAEILGLRWEHVDLEDKCLRLPDSKTGAKIVYLNGAAVELLEGLKQDSSGWVIPGQKTGKSLVNLHKPWYLVCAKAGIEGLRLHDLRHSYASVAAGLNLGLPIIGKLLGHTQAQTTARYAHLMDDPIRAAAEAIGAEIAKGMTGKVAEVVDMAAAVNPSSSSAERAAEGQN